MNKTQHMNLQSPSGYAMPYEATADTPVSLQRSYREPDSQPAATRQPGIDLAVPANRTSLQAIATGHVSAIGNDRQHGFHLSIKYSTSPGTTHSYTVTYGQLTQVQVNYGEKVKAGQQVAVSGDMLQLEVSYDGQEINPGEFLQMLYANVMTQAEAQGETGQQLQPDIPVHTPYDKDQPEIELLMLRYLLPYFTALQTGQYQVPQSTQQQIAQAMEQIQTTGVMYQHMPSMVNPLGLGSRSQQLVGLIQTLLITDMLTYLGSTHHIFLSSSTEEEKKKYLTPQ